MSRFVAVAVAALGLPLAAPAPAQVDFAKIASGVNGCPDLPADPNLAAYAALLCRPRTSLDLPLTVLSSSIQVRAGAFSMIQRQALLDRVRGALPAPQVEQL